jgi:hypothetical protein
MPGNAMKTLIVAAAVGAMAASIQVYGQQDVAAREKAEYDAAKARCEKLTGRAQENCLSEATARYRAQLKQTGAEHRDDPRPLRNDSAARKGESGKRAD